MHTSHRCAQVGLVGGACTDVTQSFYQTAKFEKRDKFIGILNAAGRDVKERTLVFVKTKRLADFLCLSLCEEGFPATSIHGDRMQSEREQVRYLYTIVRKCTRMYFRL